MKPSKPRRPYRKVVNSLYQVLKIDRDMDDHIWFRGSANGELLAGNRFSVGIWNIFKGYGGLHFLQDYRHFVESCDLVLIQEALVSANSLSQYASEGFELVHCGSYERMDGLRDGVMTLCKWPRATAPTRVLCAYPEPILKTPKVSLITNYQLPNGQLLAVANIHSTLIRSVKRSLEEIEQVIDALHDHEGPLIVGGDFNTFQESYMKRLVDRMSSLALTHVEIPKDPRRSNWQFLDHCFVRGLMVERAKVDEKICSSDHYPLKVSFVVQSEN